jgi:hypothetical protein
MIGIADSRRLVYSAQNQSSNLGMPSSYAQCTAEGCVMAHQEVWEYVAKVSQRKLCAYKQWSSQYSVSNSGIDAQIQLVDG